MNKLTVLGSGGWGTALAVTIASAGNDVMLWTRRRDLAQQMRKQRENATYLPGVRLPANVAITYGLREAVAFSEYLVLVVPAQALRTFAGDLLPLITGNHKLLNAAKGLEAGTAKRLSSVLHETLPDHAPGHIATLSGPNHAEEVGRGIPSASVVASVSAETGLAWQMLLGTPTFRVYTTDDQIGVELAGALKNVMALAAGISDGLGYGDNTKAALITRGLAEMMRFGTQLGAQPQTFSGLAGLGDLMVTCTSQHSRNRAAGAAIGSGKTLADVIAGTGMVIEGVSTCRAVSHLAREYGIEMPITETVHRILFEDESPRASVVALMNRDPKSEV